jgi:tRNA A58 N-methylase Trm61
MKLDKPYRKLSTRERALRREMKKMLTAVKNINDLDFHPRIATKHTDPSAPLKTKNVELVFIEVTDPETGECWTVGEHRD